MARRKTKPRPAATEEPAQPKTPVPEPVSIVDGIPDRSGGRTWWKILLLATIFALWVAFLVWCLIAGAP